MAKTGPIRKTCVVKIYVDQNDHDVVRVAAALQRTSLREYCRATVMREALRLTQSMKLQPAKAAK